MNKGIKIAVSGKGGVGKTTIAAFLVKLLSKNYNVLAVDADPNATLANALGFPEPEKIVPIVEMKNIIEERMGTKLDTYGTYFKLNPKVDDIPEKYSVKHENKDSSTTIKLIVMGSIKKGGKGCACPENTFLKTLVSHLILNRNEIVVMDMEAGLEHLGRGTAGSVDVLLIIVEPSIASIATAEKIHKLANDLKIKKIYVIANKIRNDSDRKIIENHLKNMKIIGFLPFDRNIIDNAVSGKSVDISKKMLPELLKTITTLKLGKCHPKASPLGYRSAYGFRQDLTQ